MDTSSPSLAHGFTQWYGVLGTTEKSSVVQTYLHYFYSDMPGDSAFAVGSLLLAALILLSLFTGSHEHSAAIYTIPMPQ